MKRGATALAAVSIMAAAALTACSSSGGSGGDGKTTLKFVGADYGTGPANSSTKYWQGIADAFHKANPKITVTVQIINWNDFDTQVQTMVQNKQYPDITEGDYFANYAQEGLLYKASDVLSKPDNLMPAFTKLGSYEGAQYGMPFTTSSRTLFYNKKLFAQANITLAAADLGRHPDRRGQDQGARQDRLRPARSAPRRRRPRRCCGCSATAATITDSSGKWTIDSAQNVATFQFLKSSWPRATPNRTRVPRTAPTCGSSSRRARSA